MRVGKRIDRRLQAKEFLVGWKKESAVNAKIRMRKNKVTEVLM